MLRKAVEPALKAIQQLRSGAESSTHGGFTKLKDCEALAEIDRRYWIEPDVHDNFVVQVCIWLISGNHQPHCMTITRPDQESIYAPFRTRCHGGWKC